MRRLALLAMASSWAGAAAVDTAAMWRELESHCARGLCTLATGSQLSALANTTDCKGRMLAYEYGLTLIPSRKPQLESFDALQLDTTCGVTRPPAALEALAVPQLPAAAAVGAAFYVSADGDDNSATGDVRAPYRTVYRALAAARASSAAAKSIVLKPGTHYLNQTIALTQVDSGTTIAAEPGAPAGSVIVSGGVPLTPSWKKSSRKGSGGNAVVWETVIKDASLQAGFKGLTTLAPHRRVTRARYPNAAPSEGAELCIDCWTSGVIRWHHNVSCVGQATVMYKDLRDCDNDKKLPSGQPCKNDSAMWDTYNTYSNGHGGCCAAWPGDHSPYGPMGNYFCGNASAGGWVGFNDPRGMPGLSGETGQLDNSSQITYAKYNGSQGLSAQLPWGFDYDSEQHPILDTIASPAGAILHVWRDQGWYAPMPSLRFDLSGQHCCLSWVLASFAWQGRQYV